MHCNVKDTLITRLFPRMLALLAIAALPLSGINAAQAPGAEETDQVVIVEGEDRTIYEYRQNGVLTMIKVVPDNGRPYYMVPANGAAHFEDLDHKRKLYPQWIIVEW